MTVVDALNRPCQQQWLTDSSGWIASPVNSGCLSSNCRSCQSTICIPKKRPIQLRFRSLSTLGYSNVAYVDIHNGMTADDQLIKRMQSDAGSPVEFTPIESTENCIFISFHTTSTSTNSGFNATYQEKGKELLNCTFVKMLSNILWNLYWCCMLTTFMQLLSIFECAIIFEQYDLFLSSLIYIMFSFVFQDRSQPPFWQINNTHSN